MKRYQQLEAQKEKGAALVVAMLVLSLVTIFAATMSVEYNFSVRRVSNQMIAQQSYSYLRATEAVAHKVISIDMMLDKDANKRVDVLDELWAKEAPPFVLEEGSYSGRLYDLQGRFNLNSLRKPAPPATSSGMLPNVPYTIEQGIFIRLLQTLSDDSYQVNEVDAIAITEAIVDWLDDDQTPNNNGNCGEDDVYGNIQNRQPHRTADAAFQSVSELRLVCNLPVELYRRLVPYVTVWPLSGKSTININTADINLLRSIVVPKTDQAKLAALTGKTNYQAPSPVSIMDIEHFLERQKAGGYDSFTAVGTDLGDFQLWPSNANDKSPLGLYTDYFLLESVASLGDLTQTMSSVISRKGGNIAIIARSTGGL